MSLSVTVKSKLWMPESMETKFEVSEFVLGERCRMGEECGQLAWRGARMEMGWKWAGASWGALALCNIGWRRAGLGRARGYQCGGAGWAQGRQGRLGQGFHSTSAVASMLMLGSTTNDVACTAGIPNFLAAHQFLGSPLALRWPEKGFRV